MKSSLMKKEEKKPFLRRLLGLIWLASLVLLIFSSPALVAAGDEGRSAIVAAHPDGEKLKAILKSLEQYAEKGMKDWGTPGMAMAIVRGDEIIYKKGFGVRKAGGDEPVTPDTLFQIGSTSKAFTVALVAMLVDEGKVKWDDRVVDHLPGFRMYDPWVTREFLVADLMAQHSGLSPYSGDLLSLVGFSRDHIQHALRFIKPVSSFRSQFAYQNHLFLVAAELVEKYSGKSWEENVRERIFKPLGMASSSIDMKSFQESKDVALLHLKINDQVTALPMDWPYLYWTYTYGPAGGINSTILDMAQWLRLQINGGAWSKEQLVNKNNMDFMHSPKTIVTPVSKEINEYYCEGWVYRENQPFPLIWHTGGTSGHKTMVAIMPKARVGLVVLSNYIGSSLPEALAYRFFDLYFGHGDRDWSGEFLAAARKAEGEAKSKAPKRPDPPAPSMALDKYAGDYRNEPYGRITLAPEKGGLILTMGPRKAKMTLLPWDRDTFMVSWPEMGEEIGFASFQVNAESKVIALTIEGLDKDGCGTFHRVDQRPN
jgi:CubicO group peptidase (beta-lactamase class C family)